jgi:lauroyl/myristoyl acyltransferase
VILWVTPTTSSDLVVRRCLAENGYFISHLSTLTHGYSESRFGVRCINAPNRAVENQYLRARIIVNRNLPGPALANIEERLTSNEIISIAAVENTGRKSLEVRILSAVLQLGAGALSFGYKKRAPVLPVFCIRETYGSYRVRIEAPLLIDENRRREEAIGEALSAFGARLERFVRQHPDQWYGWSYLRTEKSEEARTIWDWVHKSSRVT